MSSSKGSIKIDIEEWLKSTLQKEGLETYQINIHGNSEKGDNYLGEITFVEVCGKTKTNEDKIYNFVIKSAKRSTEFRKVMPIREAFKNEIFFYNEILPTFLKFQLEKGVQQPFNNAAKCFDTIILEDMEVLILGNMRNQGYSLHDRRLPMDRDYIKAIVQNYGKLHAVSFALRDQKPELFKKISQSVKDIFKMITEMNGPPKEIKLYQHVISAAKEENEQEIIEKCLLLNEKVREYNNLTDPTDPYAVILHGDCWNNNFLFKQRDDQTISVSDICFLDFQLSRLASPIYDLSYFLFTNLSADDAKDFDEINQWYYESLSDSLREMGSDPTKLFPFEELMNQWKKYSLFGLVMMPSILKICLSDKDEVPDLVEAAESGTNFANLFTKGVRSTEQYRKRALPIMKLAIGQDFI